MDTTTIEVVSARSGHTVEESQPDEELEVQAPLMDEDESDAPELSIEELEEFFRGLN
jgi:hypothetical protein